MTIPVPTPRTHPVPAVPTTQVADRDQVYLGTAVPTRWVHPTPVAVTQLNMTVVQNIHLYPPVPTAVPNPVPTLPSPPTTEPAPIEVRYTHRSRQEGVTAVTALVTVTGLFVGVIAFQDLVMTVIATAVAAVGVALVMGVAALLGGSHCPGNHCDGCKFHK